jgi:hypothetical protein
MGIPNPKLLIPDCRGIGVGIPVGSNYQYHIAVSFIIPSPDSSCVSRFTMHALERGYIFINVPELESRWGVELPLEKTLL